MYALWSSCKKDLLRRRRDPSAFVLWLGIPLAILLLMTLAFGGGSGGGSMPQARMFVVDQDGSFISSALQSAFSQGQLAEMIEAVPASDVATARAQIVEGDGSAVLVIPAGFGEALLRRTPSELELWTNPSQRVLPGILEETVSVIVDAAFYAQALAAEPLLKIAEASASGTFDAAEMSGSSMEIFSLVEQLERQIATPLIQVTQRAHEVSVDVEESSPSSLGAMLFPGIFFMAIFFVAQGVSDDVWLEKRYGTLDRAIRTPGGLGAMLGGKILAGALLITTISTASLLLGVWLFELPPGRIPLAILWSAVTGAALLCFFILIQVYCSSQRAASLVGHLLIFPLLILGGSLFPTESMPSALATIGRFTPNGWALERLKMIFRGELALSQALLSTAAMLVLTLLLAQVVKRRMAGSFARSAG